ncbi:MAG: inositol phosphorylceramide synthase [Candidatus Sericytochromatia bacterium]|nr:inositol phosphorylceramide synthase [Candidatus Sericytochromatia bacterium]
MNYKQLLNIKYYIFTQSIVGSCYYLVKKLTPYQPIELPLTYIDIWIKPNYIAVWVYMSFFFLLIAGFIFSSKENCIKCIKVILTNSVIASLFFIFLPTKITFNDYLPYIQDNTITSNFIKLIKEYDNTYNCFPSLHISNSIVSTYFLNKHKNKYIRIFTVCWLLAIVWSVMSTKQHTIYDVFGGIVLAFISLTIILYRPKIKDKIVAVSSI